MRNSDKTLDSWLVLQWKSGNKKAASLLVKRFHKKLCRQSYWYIKDLDASKDIVQDSWTVIFNKIHSLKDANRFGSWTLSIVTRKSIDWLRKNKRDVKNREAYYDYKINIAETSNEDISDNRLINLRIAINELPQQDQTVLHLFYIEEYPIGEIGEIMHLPPGTVKSRLFNAREKLKLIIKTKSHEK